ncbi:MAG TPA: hypothetical protein VFN10_23985 [Thermoanaerobaculia bacterium]|nr:hypothetical protein [Thermoanaerobaculia bacterium]
MKKQRIVSLLICLTAILLVPAAFAQTTLTLVNSTVTNTNAAVYEVAPTQTSTQLYTMFQDQGVNTKLPANGSTLISVQMQQQNVNVANTPLLITNVRLANLMSSCYQAIPPCLVLTPAAQAPGTDEANRFLAQRSTTEEYCLPGTVTTRDDARYFTLANGLVVRLMGNLEGIGAKGKECLCGVVATTPEPLNTIAFEVRKKCDKPGRERMKKK